VGGSRRCDQKKTRARICGGTLDDVAMRGLRGSLVGLCVLGAFAGRADAQTETLLLVTRSPEAQDCPDGAALLARIEQLRVRPQTERMGYEVTFTRQGENLAAQIRTQDGSGVRLLRDHGETCAALAQATAVTLALLLDSDARGASRPKDATADSLPPHAVDLLPAARDAADVARAPGEQRSEASERDADRSQVSATLAIGVAALGGVVRPIAPAWIGELGVALPSAQFSAGALWVPRQALAHGPGVVRASLLGAISRACFVPEGRALLRIALCSGVHVGVLEAQAEAYTRNDGVSKLWLALPFELVLMSAPDSIGWQLGAAALVPLLRHDFAIDGVGVAYESLPTGLLLSLRGTGTLPL
jgi:hypothetical protein